MHDIQMVNVARSATGAGLCSQLSGESAVSCQGRLKWDTNFTWPPVVLNSFELLAQAPASPRERYFVQSLVDLFQARIPMNPQPHTRNWALRAAPNFQMPPDGGCSEFGH